MPRKPSSSVQNEIKLLKDETRRFSNKIVLMHEKKRQQCHGLELLEDKERLLKKQRNVTKNWSR